MKLSNAILLFCLIFSLISCASPDSNINESTEVEASQTSSTEETLESIQEPTLEQAIKPLEYEIKPSELKPSYDKPPNDNIFKDDYIQFNYPSTWTYSVDPTEDFTSYDFSDSTSMKFWYTMGVALLTNLEYTQDDYFTMLSNQYSDLEILEFKNITIDDYDGIKLKYVYTIEDKEYFMIRYETIVGPASRRFFCTYLVEYLDVYEELCDEIILSVDFKYEDKKSDTEDDINLYEIEIQKDYANAEKADHTFDCTVKVKVDEEDTQNPQIIKFLLLDEEGKPLNNTKFLVMENYFDNIDKNSNRNDVIRNLGTTDADGKFEWEKPTLGRHKFLIIDSEEEHYYFALEVKKTVVSVRISTKNEGE